jgi:hypothetical protein
MMRAARLLEAVGSMRIADPECLTAAAEHAGSSNSRPWPCFDTSDWQQQQCSKQLPLLKLPSDMTAAEREAAGAAAAAWLAEQARSQEMLAQLLNRAQQAEMALAAASFAADDSGHRQPGQQQLQASTTGGCAFNFRAYSAAVAVEPSIA